MLAVGEHLLEDLNEQYLRMATGFAGGLGDTREELCGALSGGVMVIGALFGRATLEEDDRPAIGLAEQYRKRFVREFGYTQCARLRDRVIGAPEGPDSCAALVGKAAWMLLGLLCPLE